jgi:hypothetical protein
MYKVNRKNGGFKKESNVLLKSVWKVWKCFFKKGKPSFETGVLKQCFQTLPTLREPKKERYRRIFQAQTSDKIAIWGGAGGLWKRWGKPKQRPYPQSLERRLCPESGWHEDADLKELCPCHSSCYRAVPCFPDSVESYKTISHKTWMFTTFCHNWETCGLRGLLWL